MAVKSTPKEKRESLELGDFLGAGSFAQTYKAKVLSNDLRKKWGETVVIKIPLSKEKEKLLLKNEAGLLNVIRCANENHIVQYMDIEWFQDKQFVLVMEYMDRGSLRDILGPIGNQNVLEIDQALNFSIQICKGLIGVHNARIFHRDIKPENILINSKWELKITDFGISIMLGSIEIASTGAGTLYYMAKEVLDGKGSFYSDIYSLGVTMYEMLTGYVPFYSENYGTIVDDIRKKEPMPPMDINSKVDERLNDIILTAMNRDIEIRYKTAADLLEAINDYMIDKHIKEILDNDNLSYFEKVNSLDNLITTYSDNPKVYLNIGEFYNRNDQYQKAIEVFEEGIKLDPEFGLLYRDMSSSLANLGRHDKAIEKLEKYIDLEREKGIDRHTMTFLKFLKNKKGEK